MRKTVDPIAIKGQNVTDLLNIPCNAARHTNAKETTYTNVR